MRVDSQARQTARKKEKESMVEVDLEGDDIIMNDEVVGLYS